MDLSTFLELFTWPLVTLALASIVAPLVGVFLFARGESFHGIVLPQLATFGVAVGFALTPLLVGHGGDGVHDHGPSDPSRGYLFAWAGVATIAGIAMLEWARGAHGEGAGREAARVAATFAVASGGTAIASQLAPYGGLHVGALLSGDTLATGGFDAALLGAVTLVAVGVITVGWRDLTLAGLDPRFARVVGARPGRWNLLLHAVVASVVMVGALTVGPLPLFALLVLPPLAVRRIVGSMGRFLVVTPALGLASGVLGAVLAFQADLPMGASVVAGAAAVALIVLLGGLGFDRVRKGHGA